MEEQAERLFRDFEARDEREVKSRQMTVNPKRCGGFMPRQILPASHFAPNSAPSTRLWTRRLMLSLATSNTWISPPDLQAPTTAFFGKGLR
jgi:hypothetical protein